MGCGAYPVIYGIRHWFLTLSRCSKCLTVRLFVETPYNQVVDLSLIAELQLPVYTMYVSST